MGQERLNEGQFRFEFELQRFNGAPLRSPQDARTYAPPAHDSPTINRYNALPTMELTSLPPSSAPKRTAVLGSQPIQLSESCIVLGDTRQVLRKFTDGQFKCCVTSPPYWGLRDYAVGNQIGAEMLLHDYVQNLRLVFSEVRRVLSEEGTLWLNIGDCYTSGNRGWRDSDKKNPARAMSYRPPTPKGLKPKDLIGVPWRVAFALQAEGWHLRSDIVWYKPNRQPESVKDRPTQAHEYVFLFSKSEKYFYNYEAVREPAKMNGGKRNRRSVWSINTEPYPGAHFATFPPALVEPCVLAGSTESDYVLDPFFGSGTVGLVCEKLKRQYVGIEIKREYVDLATRRIRNARAQLS